MNDNLNLKKQLPLNLATNILSFVINIFVAIWIVPYLVNHIGIIAYGLVPLSMFFSEYINIIIQSLNSSINRFLLISLQKKDFKNANSIFSTSFVIILIFILIQTLIISIVLFDLTNFINIPKELFDDAIWLFSLTLFSFLLSLFRGVFSTTIFSLNRLDIQNTINISYTLIRVISIIILFNVNEPNLKYIGIATLISSSIALFSTIYFSKKLVPELKINLKLYDKKYVIKLFKMTGWILLNQVGFLLFLKVDLYIVNQYLGTSSAGEYSIVTQWSNLLRTMAGVFSGILTPIIMIYYARGEINKLINMLINGIKILGLFMAIPIGIVCTLSEEILLIWIGKDFTHLGELMFLSIIPLVINLSILPLFAINVSYNKVKIPALVSLFLGILNILLMILSIKYTNSGMYGILVISAVVLTVKNAIFTPLYAASILNISKMTFIYSQLTIVLFFFFVFIITDLLTFFIKNENLWTLLLIILLSGIINIIVLFIILLRDKNMKEINYLILEKLKLTKAIKKDTKNA